ncbi:MAG TPA: hypothetical protein VFC64_03675 [Atopostipes sp.]|nr:hypothetical protein [Atopostipes sp.]
MKLHKSLLLLCVSTLLLVACDDSEPEVIDGVNTETEEASSNNLIEKAIEETKENKTAGPIEFTYGVEDNVSYGDSDNYIDVEGFSYGAEQIVVIFNDTVIDVVPTESGGYFSYYSKGTDSKVPITFGTNSDAELGDTIYPGEAENETVIAFIPVEEEADDNFSIGETAAYTSGLEITITHVGLSDEKPNGEIYGNFVRVDFTVDNQTDEPFRFTAHNVELYDGDRNKAELNSKGYYSETIAVGMKGNGSAYFDAMSEGPYTVMVGAGTWISE